MTASRVPRLVDDLRALFEDVSGIDLAGVDARRTFVELGLDSLTLTQAAVQLKRRFAASVTFRQLMAKLTSLDALAQHLDRVLPPDPATLTPVVELPSAPAPAPVKIESTPFIAGGNFVERVIAEQMRIMHEQLSLLRGGVLAASSPPQTPAPSATSVTPEATAPTVAGLEITGVHRYDVKKAFGAIARIHTQSSDVTPSQRAALEAFTRRYVEKTRRSKVLTVAHRDRLADPRVVNGFRPMTKEITYQIVVERSKGSRLWDVDGNEYIDVLNGFGMNLFGWQPEFVQQAVRKQLDAGYEIGPQHPLTGEVAELFCDLTGCDRVGFCNTGSEALMAAMRIARTATCRSTIVVFTGSYHGTFDEVVVRAGRGGKGIPAAPGIMAGMFGDIRVLEYGTPASLQFIEENADDLAAVLVEPVQSRRPDFQPREFLHALRALTKARGICLIIDEVITGFRSHLRGAQELFGVKADLATYGKVAGGGFPIGLIAGSRGFMDTLDGGSWNYGDDSIPSVGVTYFAGTFVRHPLALAAAKAVLLHLGERGTDLQTQLNATTASFVADVNAFCRSVGAPLELRYFSSLWRVTWLEDHPLQDLLFAMLREKGIHVLDNFPCFMTTAHSSQDIQRVKEAFIGSISEMQDAGFLPKGVPGPLK